MRARVNQWVFDQMRSNELLRRLRRPLGRVKRAMARPQEAAPPPPDADADGSVITLQYPVRPRPRFGASWGEPPHQAPVRLVEANGRRHQEVLASIAAHRDELRTIPVHADDEREPRWINGYLPGLDTAALYSFVADRNPAMYLEVGSGNSTRVVRRAITDRALRTRIVSIDPEPRAVCDELCDEVIRQPLEDIDLAVFDRLGANDVCFIDNSHCAYQNSDVTVSFLEVVPRLAAGVLFGVHDIFLPDDYPPDWLDRWYNEQYLLAAFMLGGGGRTSVEFPAWSVARDERNRGTLESIWEGEEFTEVERHGNAFWLVT
jgi:hypothetical protein